MKLNDGTILNKLSSFFLKTKAEKINRNDKRPKPDVNSDRLHLNRY